MIAALETDEPMYVLLLGGRHVELYRVAEQTVEKVDVPEPAAGHGETLNYDEAERGAQVHSAARGLPGKQAAVFHGHGGLPEKAKQDLEIFLRRQSQPVRVLAARRYPAGPGLRRLRGLDLSQP